MDNNPKQYPKQYANQNHAIAIAILLSLKLLPLLVENLLEFLTLYRTRCAILTSELISIVEVLIAKKQSALATLSSQTRTSLQSSDNENIITLLKRNNVVTVFKVAPVTHLKDRERDDIFNFK